MVAQLLLLVTWLIEHSMLGLIKRNFTYLTEDAFITLHVIWNILTQYEIQIGLDKV